MITQREPGQIMLEAVTPTYLLPLDDIEGTPPVLDVTIDASPAAEGAMQPALVHQCPMAAKALLVRYTLARYVALIAALGVVVSGMAFIERPRRHTKEPLRKHHGGD